MTTTLRHAKELQINSCANFRQTDSEPAIARTANKGFAIAGVPCFADTFVQGGSSVLRMKFSAKTPRHRKAPKRSEETPSGFPRYGSGLHTSSTALRDCPRTWVSRKRETCVKPRAVTGKCNRRQC